MSEKVYPDDIARTFSAYLTVRRQHTVMLRQRFSLLSVAAMIVATAAVTFLMVAYRGGGFSGQQGFPFAWYWWTDVSYNGSATRGYRWVALFADVVIWVFAIISFGLLVERITQRFFRQHEHTTSA